MARNEAQLLLAAVLDKPLSWLFAHPETVPGASDCRKYRELVHRRLRGEPIAHLIGRRAFWTLELAVTPETLIPRPETELLVELALAALPAGGTSRVLDLGTGTGAIALSIASERPECQVLATDLSLPALAVAQSNALRHGLENVAFVCGDWLAPLRPTPFDLIVSNPPYIAAADPHLRSGDVRFEPRVALVAEQEGFAALELIIGNARSFLRPGGQLLLEHGWTQQDRVAAAIDRGGGFEVSCHADLAGRPRAVLATRIE